jgi:hypothetical protein
LEGLVLAAQKGLYKKLAQVKKHLFLVGQGIRTIDAIIEGWKDCAVQN